MIYKRCENPFQTQSNTNHHSVEGCQQHHELPFLLQTCGMCRDRHFKREIIFHFTIHYASSLPDCWHQSPNTGLKRTANPSDLKLWERHSCIVCSVCSCVSVCDLENHSAGTAAGSHSFYRLITASPWIPLNRCGDYRLIYAACPRLQTLLVTSHTFTNRQTNTCLWQSAFQSLFSGFVWCVWPNSASLTGFCLPHWCYTSPVVESDLFSFDTGDWPWGITLAVDHHLWEDKVCQLEDGWILLIPRGIFINRGHHFSKLSENCQTKIILEETLKTRHSQCQYIKTAGLCSVFNFVKLFLQYNNRHSTCQKLQHKYVLHIRSSR